MFLEVPELARYLTCGGILFEATASACALLFEYFLDLLILQYDMAESLDLLVSYFALSLRLLLFLFLVESRRQVRLAWLSSPTRLLRTHAIRISPFNSLAAIYGHLEFRW